MQLFYGRRTRQTDSQEWPRLRLQRGFLDSRIKFAGFSAVERVANGTLAVTEGTNAWISAKVEQSIDLGSHMLFIAAVTDV